MPIFKHRPTVVFRPTVVIGLGGTGYNVLLKLKKRFIDIYGVMPPIIQLLSIDTAENAQMRESSPDGTIVSLDNNEIYQIAINNPGQVVRLNKHIEDWWPLQVNANLPIAKGAGQVRARGRLGLFARSSEISDRIHACINRVRDLKNNKQADTENLLVSNTGGVEVYLVASIAGGTGSGMFLDIAYLTRNRDDFLNLTGVLALPRVFQGKPFTELVQSNAYGALKEIEYLWHPQPFTIDYGNKSIEVTRSPFDLLFLIDSLNEMGRVVGDPNDLQSLIADGLYVQIGSQIGVDNNNATDNIKAMLSERLVKKRRVSYCSFGVAYLTLPVNQYEKMQLEDSKQLISNELLGISFNQEQIEQEVKQFINNQQLEESTLLEVLSAKEEGQQMRFALSLVGIKFDQTAASSIKELHTRCYGTMEEQVLQQINQNYNRLLDKFIEAIDSWQNRCLRESNGLDYSKKCLHIFQNKLQNIYQKIQTKNIEIRNQFVSLKFEERASQIKEAIQSLNPFKKEQRIEEACQNYAVLVKQQCQIYLHLKRCEKAGELILNLINYIEDYCQHYRRIHSSLEKVLVEIERQLKTAELKSKTSNPFEQTLARFNLEANHPKIKHEDLIRWQRETDKSIINWSEMRASEIETEIKLFISDAYRSLTEMSIEEVLRNSDPDEVMQDLNQLWNLAYPLWRYDESKIPTTDTDIINESCYYGTQDANNTILKDPTLAAKLPKGNTNPSFVSTAEPHRITVFRVKVGVPLFALYGIEDMEQAYKNPGKAFKHLHKDWDSLKNLIPLEDDDGSLLWFALALALKIIVKRGKYYCLETPVDGKNYRQEINLGQGRIEALKEFKHPKNKELIQATETQVEAKLDYIRRSQGDESVMTLLSDYLEKVAKQLTESSQINQELKEQVEAEIEVISEYMQHIDPNSLH